ncbi:MAG: hypothetical protein KGM99_00565 [Burkholderiales bacterium]|nr:hypothetical protein [Burkholderiales bacterium]
MRLKKDTTRWNFLRKIAFLRSRRADWVAEMIFYKNLKFASSACAACSVNPRFKAKKKCFSGESAEGKMKTAPASCACHAIFTLVITKHRVD